MVGPAPPWPLTAVALVTLLGVVLCVAAGWEPGLLLIGSGLVAGALARLVLAPAQVGLLAVRSRALDAGLLGLLGIGVIVLSVTLPT